MLRMDNQQGWNRMINTGLSTTNRAIEKASKVLEGLESDAADHSREILEEKGSKASAAAALFGAATGATNDPTISKIMLDRENRKKALFDAATASQQVTFMEWLGQAEEEETAELMTGEEEGLSFYDEVHKMMDIWIQLNWLDSKQGKLLARQACILGADLPHFSVEELKKL